MLDEVIDRLQAKYPPNRVAVALGILLTPAITAGAAWLAKHGLALPAGVVFAIVVLTGTAAITLLYKFVDGWQYAEARKHDAEQRELDRLHKERVALIENGQPPGDAHSRVEGEGTGPGITVSEVKASEISAQTIEADEIKAGPLSPPPRAT